MPDPVVMETHGGYGGVWRRCYAGIEQGVVFEKDAEKAAKLGMQRPTWAVYECDCEQAISDGVGFHIPVNFVDFDPYGEPWPVIDAFFAVKREWPSVLAVAVNDGLRQGLKMGKAWSTKSMQGMVAKYGAKSMYSNYLAICQELLQEKAGQVGYTLTGWAGYYCGHAKQMAHYGAVFEL